MPLSRMHSEKACRSGSPLAESSGAGSEDWLVGAVEQAANTAASMTAAAPSARPRIVCLIVSSTSLRRGVMPAP
jgi:hypothetical protein